MADQATTKAGRPTGGTNARRAAGSMFAHLVSVIGMTHSEIAEYLDISIGSVRSYASGMRNPPTATLDDLSELWEKISFRSGSPKDLPPAAAARREALQQIRTRAWHSKRALPVSRDDRGEG